MKEIKGRRTIDSLERKNSSKRAREGKLFIEKKHCKYCGHNKRFTGNPMGLNINKCSRCKK